MHEQAINIQDEMDFFCVYLLCFLLVGDIEGARHLWRRSPPPLKLESTQLAALWTIGQHLKNDNVVGAYSAMKIQCNPVINSLLGTLKVGLCLAQLQLVSKAYSSILVEDLMVRLDLSSPDDLKTKCSELGWEISNGYVLPKLLPTVGDSGLDAGDMQDSIFILERLTQYVNTFDQKSVQVDIKGGSASSSKIEGGSSASSSSAR